MAVWVSSVTS